MLHAFKETELHKNGQMFILATEPALAILVAEVALQS